MASVGAGGRCDVASLRRRSGSALEVGGDQLASRHGDSLEMNTRVRLIPVN